MTDPLIHKDTQRALRGLRMSGPCAEGLLRDFAVRKRARKEISVDSLMRKLRLPRYKIIATFRLLAGLGLGRFIKGRGEYKSRFRFSVPAPVIGRAAFH